jgi:hypothetical protein
LSNETEALGNYLKANLIAPSHREDLKYWFQQDLKGEVVIGDVAVGDGGFTINFTLDGKKKALKVEQS